MSAHALLLSAMGFFAILAQDIAVPTLVLSMMALLRWVVAPVDVATLKGEAA